MKFPADYSTFEASIRDTSYLKTPTTSKQRHHESFILALAKMTYTPGVSILKSDGTMTRFDLGDSPRQNGVIYQQVVAEAGVGDSVIASSATYGED